MKRACLGLIGVLLASGCYDSTDLGADGSTPPVRPGTPDTGPTRPPPPPPPPPPPVRRAIDLLAMVDNSNSMTEEQASFALALPEIVAALADGDLDRDGVPDVEPVESLTFGVVTSDMGTGGFTVPTCLRSDLGDDGTLRTQGATEVPGCMATYPSFLEFRPERGRDPADFGQDARCVARVGTGGCGFEQQLEAALKALSPSAPTPGTAPGYEPPVFFRGSLGHGDRENDGFVSDDSVLAVVLLTDEEDCSAIDPDLFNPSSATYGATDLNLRCFAHADRALHPVRRYVDGLLQLRSVPDRLVFVPIAGVPADLAPAPGAPVNWEALVGPPGMRDPRMEERVDPSSPNRLIPSCSSPGRGQAFPPIRILRVARDLESRGAHVRVGSICQDELASVILDGLFSAL